MLCGDDDLAIRARRSALIAQATGSTQGPMDPGQVERFHLEEDAGTALVGATRAVSLFATPRILDASPLSALSAENATALAACTGDDLTTIILSGGTPNAAVKKALAGLGDAETFTVPRTKAAQLTRISTMARESGITLDPAVRDLIASQAGHDLPRVAGLLAQCSLVGLAHPTPAQVTQLLGSSRTPSLPWALADAVEAGDVGLALAIADGLEPVAAVSYLSTRVGQLGRIVEDDITDPAQTASAFGLSNLHAARKLTVLATRIGARGVADSWDLLSRADRAVKASPNPRAVLDVTVVRLARVWSGAARSSAAS